MKKPKSKEKQIAANKRGAKRSERLRDSRKKVAKKREELINKRKAEKEKFLKFMMKLEEARNRA